MIALDAMGGDYAPREIVIGAFNAARKDVPIILFGDKTQLISILHECGAWQGLSLTIEHCSETIAMDAIPSTSVIKKKDASLVRAMKAVASSKAQAVVTAGNSGAALVAGTLILGRVDGIYRPAIGEFLPTKKGSIFCIDLGANTDCKPHYLYHFAVMGSMYVTRIKGIKQPRVALLSNGAEAYKGSQAVRETYEILERSPLHFIGNVEARDIFDTDIDVLVCDGFAGNIMLKTIQGTMHIAAQWIQEEIEQLPWWQKVLSADNQTIITRLKDKADYQQTGASLLLGVNHPLLIGHGCSTALAIENALLRAHKLVKHNFITTFNTQLVTYLKEQSGLVAKVKRTVKSVLHLR